MKVYEVVENADEHDVTLYRTLDRKKAESVVRQIKIISDARVEERELETFSFGEKMYLIYYSGINVPSGKTYYSKEINYEPECTMKGGDYRTISIEEIIP